MSYYHICGQCSASLDPCHTPIQSEPCQKSQDKITVSELDTIYQQHKSDTYRMILAAYDLGYKKALRSKDEARENGQKKYAAPAATGNSVIEKGR